MTAILALVSKFKLWLYAGLAAAFAALLAYAKFEEHAKRKAQDDAAAHEAEQVAADAQAKLQHAETRDEVHTQVEQMPTPLEPQPVATAPAGSAAAELRNDWSRPAGQ